MEVGCGPGPVARALASRTGVDRGADALLAAGGIGVELAETLKAEARRRSEAGEFYGHIAYASLIARKPAQPALES